MPSKKSTSRGRKAKRSTPTRTSRSKSRSHSGSVGRDVKIRKPRRLRSQSKEAVYPVGHERKRSRSKIKIKGDKCRSLQAMDSVSESMNLTDLQHIAKKKGIAFGGLTKKQLVRKICDYS